MDNDFLKILDELLSKPPKFLILDHFPFASLTIWNLLHENSKDGIHYLFHSIWSEFQIDRGKGKIEKKSKILAVLKSAHQKFLDNALSIFKQATLLH